MYAKKCEAYIESGACVIALPLSPVQRNVDSQFPIELLRVVKKSSQLVHFNLFKITNSHSISTHLCGALLTKLSIG